MKGLVNGVKEETDGPGSAIGADFLRCDRCGRLDRTLFIGERFRTRGTACGRCGSNRTVDDFKCFSADEVEAIQKGEYDNYRVSW